MNKRESWSLIEAPIPNAPEGKYISQIPSPTNLLTISSALKSVGVQNISFFNFLKERNPNIVYSDHIVFNLGEATCMDYLYNYALKYLAQIRFYNPKSTIYLTGYHAWLHKEKFQQFHLTSPHFFEDDIIQNENHDTEWANDWEINDWRWMKENVCSVTKGIRATIRASRGCPHKCRMCPVLMTYKRKIRRFSVNWVMNEINTLYHRFEVRQIGFLDDNLFFDKKWGYDLLHQIINSKFKHLSLTFEEGLDVPSALDEQLLSLLKEAKFTHIKLGVESFNKETLNFINKPYKDPDLAIKAIKLLQKHKLNPTCFICIGFPTDTEESIEKDIKTLVDLGVKLRVQILWAYPGVDFVGKSLSKERLRELQAMAMNMTGSSSWRVKPDKKITKSKIEGLLKENE